MDDEAFARSADAMQERLKRSPDRRKEMASIFSENGCVFGLYPDPESITRWDKYVMKGSGNLTGNTGDGVACLWCRSIEEAIALAHSFGDDAAPRTK